MLAGCLFLSTQTHLSPLAVNLSHDSSAPELPPTHFRLARWHGSQAVPEARIFLLGSAETVGTHPSSSAAASSLVVAGLQKWVLRPTALARASTAGWAPLGLAAMLRTLAAYRSRPVLKHQVNRGNSWSTDAGVVP